MYVLMYISKMCKFLLIFFVVYMTKLSLYPDTQMNENYFLNIIMILH